jgi:5-methylcytosine-specific restriction endonuclease McrA
MRNRIPTIQHNIPISKGGKHELGNISVICKECNITIQDNATCNLNANEVENIWKKISKKEAL